MYFGFGVFTNSQRLKKAFYLRNQSLVLTQPRFSHSSFPVEAGGQHLQLLLANQLIPQGQLPFMLGLLKSFPCLLHKQKQNEVLFSKDTANNLEAAGKNCQMFKEIKL